MSPATQHRAAQRAAWDRLWQILLADDEPTRPSDPPQTDRNRVVLFEGQDAVSEGGSDAQAS
jgi:hypothetical protein